MSPVAARLACVVLAHQDPQHLHRLLDALDPLPVFLHVDAATDAATHAAMVADLPARVRLLPRLRTGWASWEIVAAELAGYAAALEQTDATHVALLTGSDYPLAGVPAIEAYLADHPGTSLTSGQALPFPLWGRDGGMARLRYRHWVHGKRMLRLPLPRRIPVDLQPAGGSQLKILAREHVRALLDVVAQRPDLVEFFGRVWIPDETFVLSVLNSPRLVPGFVEQHLERLQWHIGWDEARRKSPPYLTVADLPDLLVSAGPDNEWGPALFARKFATVVDTAVLDAIDVELRGVRVDA